MPLKRVQAGDEIRASDINAIIDFVEQRLRVRSAQGMFASWDQGGLVMALAHRPEYLVPAIITDNGGNSPRIASTVRYYVQALGSTSATLDNVLPSFGRPVKGAEADIVKIRPARVGAFCFIIRQPEADGSISPKLWIIGGGEDGETLLAARCTVTP